MKTLISTLMILVGAPIWYYLLYKILVGVNATELMWFLYYIYVPVGLFGTIASKIVDKDR